MRGMPQGTRYGGGGVGGPGFTDLSKRVLGALLALYIAQLLVQWVDVPVLAWLALHEPDTGLFRPWQLLTAFLLQGPDPLRAFFDWLFLFFLLPPIEGMFGRRQLASVAAVTWLLAAVLGGGLMALGIASTGAMGYLGLTPFLTMLLVLFGLSQPNAQILLFFVLPIRASWVAWGTGLLSLLFFLASRSVDSAMACAGWLAGYLWLTASLPGGLRRPFLKMRQQRIQRKLRRFEVVEGGRDDDGPVIH